MRASVPLSLVGLAVLLTVLGLVRRPFTPTGAADGELVRQLRQELAVAQRSLREQALLAERSQLATQSLARPSPGSATGVGVRSYTHSVATMPMRRGDWAMMTYATGGVHEMLHNWVLHVQRIGAPILAIAMDEPVLEQCSRQRFDCLDWSKTKSSLDSSYVRGDESGFRKLGVRKVDALVAVLRAGVHAILSDVDCVWSHDPGPLVRGIAPGYAAFAQADLISATDCMSPDSDLRDAGCFSGLIDKNTGVLAVRATEDGIRAMREWRHRLAIGQKNEQDQTTFVDMVDGNGRGHRWGMTGPQRAAWREFGAEWCGTAQHAAGRGFSRRSGAETEGERGTFDVCLPNVTRTLRMGVFPITDVAGGHTFFVQNLQAVTGKWPAAVHATYQFGDQVRRAPLSATATSPQLQLTAASCPNTRGSDSPQQPARCRLLGSALPTRRIRRGLAHAAADSRRRPRSPRLATCLCFPPRPAPLPLLPPHTLIPNSWVPADR
jgi:hypothetical protein